MRETNQVTFEEGVRLLAQGRRTKGRGRTKYNAKKCCGFDGQVFDSKREADVYYNELLPQLQAGIIKVIRRQQRFDIIVNDNYIGYYRADFDIEYTDGRREVWDVKGFTKMKRSIRSADGKVKTQTITSAAYEMFLWKKKLVQALYGIEIKEIK